MKLPEKQSELLRLAVSDAKKIARSNDYMLDMLIWHRPTGDGRCLVCMAGAVMVNTLDSSIKHDLSPEDFNKEYTELHRINNMRVGYFDGYSAAELKAREIIRKSYNEGSFNGRASWEAYLEAADILEEAGL